MNWLTGWKHRKKITVQDVFVDGNLTNFPAYVFINADADFHEARADGYDIRFTLSDGKTLLKYEREHWTGGNGSPATAHFWVKVPSILAAGGTIIYIYYGKSDAPDGEDAPNVWDANFKGIWHMKDITPSKIADSTGVNDGTKKAANEPIEADGKVGKCLDFDGDDDYISIPHDSSLDITGAITISGWIKPGTITGGHGICSKDYAARACFAFYQSTSELVFEFWNTAWHTHATSGLGLEIGTWYHFAVTFDPDTDTVKIYVNGVEEYSATDETSTVLSNYHAVQIGALNNTIHFDGLIDEVRISNIARTLAWLKFGHHNINEADNEIVWGDEESLFPIIFDVIPRKRILNVEARTRIHNVPPRGRIFDRRSA